jgi:triacylglycerol lipase
VRKAAAFHDDFVEALNGAGGAYAATEAATASALRAAQQDALAVVNAPTQGVMEHPLIGTGGIGNGFGFVQHEIAQTPTTLATKFTQQGNTLFDEILAAPPIAPVPATGNPTFTGTPSLLNRLEIAALRPLNELLTVSGF